MSFDVTCPSGLQARVRALKVKEEKILTDNRMNREGKVLPAILQACTEKLLDPGPYDFEENIKWSSLLRGDRLYLLLKIREATYGANYEFSLKCSNRSCQEKIEWEVDTNDLPIQTLPPGVGPADKVTVKLPDSQVEVSFHPARGEDEEVFRKLKKKLEDAGPITVALLARIDEISGVDASSLKAKRDFIEDLSMEDAMFIREAFDANDCGVHTGIDIECPHCGELQTIELPLDRGFFLREKRSKASSRSSKESSGGMASSLSAGISTEEAD